MRRSKHTAAELVALSISTALWRVTKVTDPLNQAVESTYDKVGNVKSLKDKRGIVSETDYDDLYRPIEKRKAAIRLVSYEYDAANNVTADIDANSNRTEYVYTRRNQKEKATFADTATRSYIYDGNGNLKTETDEEGIATSYGYDKENRPTATERAGETTQKSYDSMGNLAAEIRPEGNSRTYAYDLLKRLITATDDPWGPSLVTSYEYDKNNNLVKKKSVTYPNGAGETYDYYPTNRVQAVTNSVNNTTISRFDYIYDQNGNRQIQDETRGSRRITTSYRYDTLDRMTSYSVTEGSNNTQTDYTFDGYNRQTETIAKSGSPKTSKTYSYDETDWLTQISDGARTITYVYDNNGNTIRKNDSTEPTNPTIYAYDARDKLTSATKGATTLGDYSYNAQGYRIWNRNSDRGDVEYLYDGTAVIEERNGAGLLAHYRYANKLFSLTDGTNNQYYHLDALGSTTDLTDDTGATKASYFLNPWGMIVDSLGDSVNRKIFTGKEIDQNTGLVYFGARYYDPDTARFMTQDIYLGEQTTPPSLHRYLYAYSNPTVFIDLEGYESLEWRAAPEKGFFDKWIFDREHAKDIYRGLVNDSPVGHYRPESARTDAMMDLISTGLEFKVGGDVVGTVAGKLKQPAKNLLEKVVEKLPGAVKDAVKTVTKVTTEIKNGAQELGQELLEETISVIKNSPVGNNVGAVDNISKRLEKVTTGTDEAFFWSGRSNGIGGERVAKEIAESHGGTTLEMLIKERGIKMPDWDPNNPKSIKAWEKISKEYAKKASGTVRAVIGEDMRPGSIWEEVELPALLKNKKVEKIITIDPATKAEKTIFDRNL